MTFTAVTTAEPPSARLTLAEADLPAGTHTVSVVGRYSGLSYPVRGGSNRFAAGGVVITDTGIPTGVPVSYRAHAFDDDGAPLGVVDSAFVEVAADPRTAWFSDPVNPALVVKARLDIDFASELSRARQVQTYQVGNRLVALLGAKGKLESIPMRVHTDTLEQADTLAELLSATAILVRTPPPHRLPRLLYVIVPTVKEVTGDIPTGGSWLTWDLAGQEVSPTTLDILIPVVTWQSFIDAFPGATWQDVIDFYADDTWFDVIRGFSGGS